MLGVVVVADLERLLRRAVGFKLLLPRLLLLLGLRLRLTHAQRDALAEDASGDRLDAVLCLMQAAWGELQGPPRWGLPAQVDPLEGWIVSA